MSGSSNGNADFSETAWPVVRRLIAERVLVTDICRDRFANVHDF